MRRIAPVLVLLLSLAACAGMPAVDQAAVDANAKRIAPMVVTDCSARGAFALAGGVASVLVPAAALGIGIADRVIDKACADPDQVARDISAAEEAVRAAAQR